MKVKIGSIREMLEVENYQIIENLRDNLVIDSPEMNVIIWDQSLNRMFAVYCAENVLSHWKKKYPENNLPEKALELAHRLYEGPPAEEEIEIRKEMGKVRAELKELVDSLAPAAMGQGWYEESVIYAGYAACDASDTSVEYASNAAASAVKASINQEQEREGQVGSFDEIVYNFGGRIR